MAVRWYDSGAFARFFLDFLGQPGIAWSMATVAPADALVYDPATPYDPLRLAWEHLRDVVWCRDERRAPIFFLHTEAGEILAWRVPNDWAPLNPQWIYHTGWAFF